MHAAKSARVLPFGEEAMPLDLLRAGGRNLSGKPPGRHPP